MSKKIFRSIMAVSIIVLAASLFIATVFLHDFFTRSQTAQLKEQLALSARNTDRLGVAYFEGFESSVFRYTLVSADGSVLYDTQASADRMENHSERKEIADALRTGHGNSSRYSSTLTERTLYEAVRLENGNVLRISATQITAGALLVGISPAIAITVLSAVLLAAFLSKRMADGIVRPLNELDLDHPEENDSYEELTPLLKKLDKQHRQITSQMQVLKQKADEFRQITASMNEGLVLLNEQGKILSINHAAARLFGADSSAIGRDFLTLDRSESMNRAIKTALRGKRCEFREERGEREYRFFITRIESGDMTVGIVLLCLDVTETAFAERNRREFTANVSHELKTPLQSIIGSAELLESGLVKPEDTARFVGNIKKEAARLVTLINDIIRLSQLDEETAPVREPVELYGMAREVLDALAEPAAKKKVSLDLQGDPCEMNGNRRYLYEILYNLCDNAIRYNQEGGRVTVGLTQKDGTIALTVRDTGIGIPNEDQPRVFERFYRVDKSHSRETGGTGLGLSIVKHAVAYHGGSIRLDSTPGKGTAVTVLFPKF